MLVEFAAGSSVSGVDMASRTIRGLVVEWGTVAPSGGRRWRFQRGSLHWSSPARIKLNRSHNRDQLIGVATELKVTPRGLVGTFRIARTAEGDEALDLAKDGILDGYSIEVDFGDDDEQGPDPADRTVTLVRRGTLRGVALTGVPAFDEARVGAFARDDRLEVRMSGEETSALRMVAESNDMSMGELVRRSVRAYTRQRPVYSFTGEGHSFVRDSWVSNHPSDGDAHEAHQRLQAFKGWQREQAAATFATVTTTSAAAVVEPGYEPTLSSFVQDRPLFAASTKGTITDATSFILPGQVTDANVDAAVATNVEGTGPTDGTLTFATAITVSPTGISGLFRVTREIVDASNPAIDAVALSVMRESYGRQTEARIFTELNVIQGGTITAGFVPSGAMARTSTGVALPADLRKTVLAYVNGRGTKARSVIASSRTTVAEALETLDMTAFALRDVSVELSPKITGTAAGDGDVFVLSSGDLWAWSSPLLQFEYGERQGPGMVDLALFGYFATRVINARGVASIRHT